MPHFLRYTLPLIPILLWGCTRPPVEAPPSALAKGDLEAFAQLIDQAAEERLEELELASISIAVADADGVFWAEEYGLADVEAKVPADPDTLYRVGSISKLFTTVALMRLVEAGRIDLDAPLTTYLPEFELGPPPPFLPGAAEWKLDDITIRSMLTHSSGIPSDILKGFFTHDPVPHSEYMGLLKGYHAQAPVGLAWAYSNVAMTLLGHVVERVSGTPFAEYVRANVLQPTGMRASSFAPSDSVPARVAASYQGGAPIDPRSLGMIPAGGLFSSARELGSFAQMALRRGEGANGRVLSEASFSTMWAHQNANTRLAHGFEMGLGWFRNPPSRDLAALGEVVGHNGGMVAHRSVLLLALDHGIAAIALTNSAEGGEAASDLAILALRRAIELRSGAPAPAAEELVRPALASPVDPERLRSKAGRYATFAGDMRVRAEGDALRTERLAFLSSAELRPTQDGAFAPRVRLLGLIPLRLDDLDELAFRLEPRQGVDSVLVSQDGGADIFVGWRIAPTPASPAWHERLGRYEVTNLGSDHPFLTEIELALDDEGILIVNAFFLDSPLPLKRSLETLSDDEACDWALGRSGGTRLRAVQVGDATELEMLGYRFRRLD